MNLWLFPALGLVTALALPASAQTSGPHAVPGAASGGDPAELARSRNCLSCHAVASKLVGPAFRDVAARYGRNPNAHARLVQKVLKGSSGVWGTIAMPPNPQVSEPEADALVKWVLQQ